MVLPLAALKIAFLRRNGIGDLLCALPLLKYCQELFPLAEITLFVEERCRGLLPYIPEIKKGVVFSPGTRYFKKYRSILEVVAKHRGFDLAISARPEPLRLANFFLLLLKAKKKMAVVDQRFWTHLGVNAPIEGSTIKGPHQALRLLQLLAPDWEDIPKRLYPRLIPLKPYEEEIKKQLIPSLFSIFVSVSNNRQRSRISCEKYARILNRLYETKKFQVAISSLSQDRLLAENLQKQLKCPSTLFCASSFDSFLALLNVADFLWLGDGGAMHLAAALDKPQLVLWSDSVFEKWWPLTDKAIHLHHPDRFAELVDDKKIFEALEKNLLNS